MGREFRIAHAKILLEGLGGTGTPEFFRSALYQSWTAGVEATRYGRSWKLSKRTELDNDRWTGRLGFVREGELSTLNWDDQLQDFERGEASSGVVVPFVITCQHRIVSFQLFPGKVRPHTVTGSLQALLNAEGAYIWKVSPFSLSQDFDKWRGSVSRVSMFKANLSYPNPSWEDRATIQRLMDTVNAKRTSLMAQAEQDESIDTNANLVQEALEHARRGYGRVTLTGTEIATGSESQFSQTADGGLTTTTDRMLAADEAVEATPEVLSDTRDNLIANNLSNPAIRSTRGTSQDLEDEPAG